MWKTFVASPLAGGISALLGWMGALMFEGSMSEGEFATLRFGWAGTIVGGVAIACVLMLLLSGPTVEPLVLVGSAAVVAALLWNSRELPFSTTNFRDGTNDTYWFAVTMMIVIFVLLLLGLRAARETNNRAQG